MREYPGIIAIQSIIFPVVKVWIPLDFLIEQEVSKY